MTDTAIVQYKPAAPVGNASTLKALLEKNQDSILTLLPKHVTPDRIVKTMLVAANRNQKILECTQASIFETIQRAAELGLDLSGTLGEAYPVPYKSKDQAGNYRYVCQLIIGYRGLAKLARQSGQVFHIEAEAVYENDHFVYKKGSEPKIEFGPLLTGDRGKLLGFYALVLLDGGAVQTEWMDKQAVDGIRARSKSKDDGPWKTDYSEMGRKTVFRRLAKWLPLSSEKFTQALEVDSEDYEETHQPQPTIRKSGIQVMEALAAEADPGEEIPEAEVMENEGAPPMPEEEPEPDPPTQDLFGRQGIEDALVEAARKMIGRSGPSLLRSFVQQRFKKPIDQLSEKELDQVEAFLKEKATG